jgi:hypothetical protein
MIILVITKTTGIVTKGLTEDLETIPLKKFNRFTTKELGTSHTMQEVLQSET